MGFTKHDEAKLSPSRRKRYEIPFHLTSLFDRKMYTYIIFEYRKNQKVLNNTSEVNFLTET